MTKTAETNEQTMIEDDAKHRQKQAGYRLRWARERHRLTQLQLAEMCGTSQQTIQKFENGDLKNPSFLDKAAEILEVKKDWIFGLSSYNEILFNEQERRAFVDEIGNNGSKISVWSIPPHATGLPADQNKNLEIREVVGDSMAPEFRSGDFVLVNTADTSPSPAGLFMIHDGHGLTLRRVEPLPSGNLRLSASNPAYSPMEAAKTDVRIYGRIVLKIARV